MAKIDSVIQKTTSKTMSFFALKKIILSKDCVAVHLPLKMKTSTLLVDVSKKEVFKSIMKPFATSETMFEALSFERVDLEKTGKYTIVISANLEE